MPTGTGGSLFYKDWLAYECWRFVFVQKMVRKLAQTALDFPPMQKGASFNLQALKEELEKRMAYEAGAPWRAPAADATVAMFPERSLPCGTT